MKKHITFYILAFLGIAGASLCSCSNDSSDNTAISLAVISQNNAPSPIKPDEPGNLATFSEYTEPVYVTDCTLYEYESDNQHYSSITYFDKDCITPISYEVFDYTDFDLETGTGVYTTKVYKNTNTESELLGHSRFSKNDEGNESLYEFFEKDKEVADYVTYKKFTDDHLLLIECRYSPIDGNKVSYYTETLYNDEETKKVSHKIFYTNNLIFNTSEKTADVSSGIKRIEKEYEISYTPEGTFESQFYTENKYDFTSANTELLDTNYYIFKFTYRPEELEDSYIEYRCYNSNSSKEIGDLCYIMNIIANPDKTAAKEVYSTSGYTDEIIEYFYEKNPVTNEPYVSEEKHIVLKSHTSKYEYSYYADQMITREFYIMNEKLYQQIIEKSVFESVSDTNYEENLGSSVDYEPDRCFR